MKLQQYIAVGLLATATATATATARAEVCAPEELRRALSEMTDLPPWPYELDARDESSVRLRAHDPHLLVERTRDLPRQGSCANQAEVAATVLRAWAVEVRSVPLPSSPTGPASLPSPVTAAPPRLEARATRPGRPPWEVEAGLVVSLAGSDAAVGGLADARLSAGHRPLWFGLGVVAVSTRELKLGNGGADWTRAAARVSAGYRLSKGPWQLDLRIALLPALLYSRGVGFARTYQREDFDLGLGAGLRGARQWTRFALALAVDVVDWPLGRQLTARDPNDAKATVPPVELLFSLQVALRSMP